jgi:PAS domain S-box-containing protein
MGAGNVKRHCRKARSEVKVRSRHLRRIDVCFVVEMGSNMVWDRVTHSGWVRYLTAALIVLAAAAVRLGFLGGLGTRVTYVTFCPATMIAAHVGGLPAGLFATFLSAFSVFLMSDPQGHAFISDQADRLEMVVFVLCGILISCLRSVTHRALIRAKEAEAQAKLSAEREQSAAAIEESENRLSLAIESAEIGPWDFDPVSGSLTWSEQCEAVLGVPPDTVVNYETVFDRLYPDDRQRVHETIQRSLDPAGSGMFEVEYRAKWLDGAERWVLAKGRAFFDSVQDKPRAMRFIGTVLDVTDQRSAQCENEIALEILKIINSSSGISELLKPVATFFQERSGCEAVGIRLKEGEDYPYAEARGFPSEFYETMPRNRERQRHRF